MLSLAQHQNTLVSLDHGYVVTSEDVTSCSVSPLIEIPNIQEQAPRNSSPAAFLTELQTVQPDLIQESFPELYSLLGQNITKHENLIQNPEDVVDPSVNGYEPETGHHLPAEIVQEDCSSNSSLFSDNDLDDPTYVPQESSESEISFSDVIEISQPTTVDTNTVPSAVSNQYKLVPYSDSDSNDDMINIPEKGKKRVRNQVNWKKKLGKEKYFLVSST
ncbi:hypothetical protein J6590_000045 [Homalodisca vitripennis]|nr:hypothetical protein J6590_000045 [Homalodisca vitripennis]